MGDDEQGRIQHFSSGAGESMHPLGYRNTSVMDTLTKSGIGLAEPDRARLLPTGDMLPSRLGMSASTWDKATWLKSPIRPIG